MKIVGIGDSCMKNARLFSGEGKKFAIIAIVAAIALAACVTVWLILMPSQEIQSRGDPARTDAWKLERTQGEWASEDSKFALDILNYDFTLKIDGVYALIGSFYFEASEQDMQARFNMRVDPSSCIYPDAEDAIVFDIDEMWHEQGAIFIRHAPLSDGTECEPVRLILAKTNQMK